MKKSVEVYFVGGRGQGKECFRWEKGRSIRIKAEKSRKQRCWPLLAEWPCQKAVRENLERYRALKAGGEGWT